MESDSHACSERDSMKHFAGRTSGRAFLRYTRLRLVCHDGERRRFRVLRSVNCGRLRCAGLGCSFVSLVPHCTTDHRDRFHFVPAALRVKLPRNVALRSVHTIHGMILTGPSGPSDDDANRRNLNPRNTYPPFVPAAIVTRHRTARAASTLRTTRRRDMTSTELHS